MKKSAILLVSLMLSTSVAYADDQAMTQFMTHMAHANPVPNYVSVIKQNAQALGLSKEQMDQVMAWNNANTKKMQSMVMSVIEGEQQIKQASLAGVDNEEIMQMAKALGETRLNIIAGKTRCRDQMMSILDEAQWQKLAAMVK
jgi:hypothetical protein